MLLCASFFRAGARPIDDGDVFIPIARYMEAGDSDKLSVWFADNLQVDVLGTINNCTRNQARLIIRNFFANHTPNRSRLCIRAGAPR